MHTQIHFYGQLRVSNLDNVSISLCLYGNIHIFPLSMLITNVNLDGALPSFSCEGPTLISQVMDVKVLVDFCNLIA